jgi:predicted DNA-binding protein (UPF0278 family)
MPAAAKRAIASYRRRLKQKGLLRVEVQVRKEDAPLVRAVAGALIDPDRRQKFRQTLRDGLLDQKTVGLKALLADAPLDGIDLRRRRDRGRPVRL